MFAQLILIVLAILTIAALSFTTFRHFQEVRKLRARYSGVIDVDTELATVANRLEQAKREQKEFELRSQQDRTKLEDEYRIAVGNYESLKSEVALLEENLEDISYGLYKPHFSFQTSEE